MTNAKTDWYEFTSADFEGRGWQDTEYPFDRIPVRIKRALPEVYDLGHSSTGMCTFFNTDSKFVCIRCKLNSEQFGEDNFNVTAFSGFDLYIFDESERRWRWASASPHFAIKSREPEYELINELTGDKHCCRLYAPLRNHLLSVAVGVESGASFEKVPPRSDKPLVYYGTSIVHGAYATRSGLGVAQLLGRKLDLPLINLGFSGSARMEREMAELLSELDPAMYLVDTFHNMTPELIQQNAGRFLDILCSARPDTPVFFASAPHTFKSWLRPAEKAEQQAKTLLFRQTAEAMMKKYRNFHFIPGEDFYGSDDVSMDGIHPNDSAFAHMSDILTREIEKYL